LRTRPNSAGILECYAAARTGLETFAVRHVAFGL